MANFGLGMLCLAAVLMGVRAFNVETQAWRHLSKVEKSFGYRVTQQDSSSLLVSAPLEQYELERRGRVFKCQLPDARCSPLNIDVPNSAVNMSLGLTMTRDDIGKKTVVCGPTIPKECDQVTYYGGMCFGLSDNSPPTGPLPPTLEECPRTDIAFLLDGSGSVRSYDFLQMKSFVINLIKKLLKKNTWFAIAQFSSSCKIHLNFNEFQRTTTWESQVNRITQLQGGTQTASAINMLLDQLFVDRGGSRPNAKKILIVITDGESQDRYQLPTVIQKANDRGIIRYAIGVGSAFNSYQARNELNQIASSTSDHVFRVDNFAALERISSTLEKNIIAIEGTQSSGEATQMEFAQNGFSAVYASRPAGSYFLGAVGAYGWTGAYQQDSGAWKRPTSVKIKSLPSDSYLGYSMDVAWKDRRSYVILGAPRHQHKGMVMVITTDDPSNQQTLYQSPRQIGAYYGAEVCVVDLEGDGSSDLILVAAPMHLQDEQEGTVFVYKFNQGYFFSTVSDTGISLKGIAGQRGRFGLSLASLADLNGDGIRDIAVGAPMENDGQGSIYIFKGRKTPSVVIDPEYSQRIEAVQPNLQFFGLSLASTALDHSRDKLPDIVVGSSGKVFVLRSRPIVSIRTTVTFNPPKIPTSVSDCTQPERIVAKMCFIMRKKTPDSLALQGSIKYNLTLDSTRKQLRASFTGQKRTEIGQITLIQRETCHELTLFVECAPEDILNPLSNSLSFVFDGLPIPQAENLSPVLTPSSQTSSIHSLDFEIDCGRDKVCVDNLNVDFNFSGSALIEVGIAQELNVTVMVENSGENSYNTHLILHYPPGLSYRTFNKMQGRIECKSMDSEDGLNPGRTTCEINRPVFKAGDKVVFVLHYGIGTQSQLGSRVNFTAKVNSGNREHNPASILLKTRSIGVKYSIYVNIKRFEDSTNFINFTIGKELQAKPVQQHLQVVNAWRDLKLSVLVRVPLTFIDTNIWTDLNDIKIPGCPNYTDVQPVGNVIHKLQENRTLDCSVATCRVFTCIVFLSPASHHFLNISGNVSSSWIEKTGLGEAQFDLITEATMEYDQSKFIYSSDVKKHPGVSKIKTIIEVYEVPNFTKEIIGGTVGGLLLLALITAGLVKAGFFKSQYQQMMQEASQQEADLQGPPE